MRADKDPDSAIKVAIYQFSMSRLIRGHRCKEIRRELSEIVRECVTVAHNSQQRRA